MKQAFSFAILNASKGPAVRATRAQADRVLYRQAIRHQLQNQSNLTLFQQAVDDILIEGDRVSAVVTQIGLILKAQAIVLTVGTIFRWQDSRGYESICGRARRRPSCHCLGATPAGVSPAGWPP